MNTALKMAAVRQQKELTRESISELESQLPKLKLLNDMTMDKPRGYTIEKNQIEAITGIDAEQDDKGWKKVTSLWKRAILWVRGIDVVYSHKIGGYEFLSVDRHLTVEMDKRMAAAERKLRKEAHKLLLIRDDDLNDHQRQLRLHLANQANDSAGKINSQRSMALTWKKRPETLPRIG